MLRRWQSRALLVLLGSSLASVACGDDDDDSAGFGGKTGTGGKKAGGGSAGASSKGGSGGIAQGGAVAQGGRAVQVGGSSAGGLSNQGGGTSGARGGQAGAGPGETGGSGPGEGGAGGNAGSGGAEAGSGGAGGEGGGSTSLDLCSGVELPTGGYYVAPGLCARAVASSQGKLRQLTFDAQGSLLGVKVDGAVMRYRDLNQDGMFAGAGEVVSIADTGGNGNNVHLDTDSNYLYAGTPEGVKRWLYSTSSNDLGAGEVVVTGQPSTGNHTFHTVHVYDGWMYVHSGSAANASTDASPDYDANRSVLKRFRLADFTPGTPFSWSAGTPYVRGIRNMVGFTRNQSGRMYGVINGMDDVTYQNQDVHLDNPGEDLVSLQANEAHGYPYCFTAAHIVTSGGVVAAGSQLAGSTSDFTNPHNDAWCAANSVPPVTFLPAHAAPLDLTFFDNALPRGGLPESFRGGAFVSLHGSWNTSPSVGHQVVWVPFDAAGGAPMPIASTTGTTFPFTVVFGGGTATAPAAGSWGWQSGSNGESPVRPVGVAVSPTDGALYVSSDNSTGAGQGSIYRIARR